MNKAVSQEKLLAESLSNIKKIREKLPVRDDGNCMMTSELDALDDMIQKLESGSLEIAVFGEVSSGKSSLLNALIGAPLFEVGARNGVTVVKDRAEWTVDRKEVKGNLNSRLLLADTPGINEVDGEARTRIAEEVIRDADMVLFVIKADINEVEFRAICDLHRLSKPMVVAFNKSDTYSPDQRREILDAVADRLEGIVSPENIIPTAGAPKPMEVMMIDAQGNESLQLRTPKPAIDDLKARILEILVAEGKTLIALNTSIFTDNISQRIAERRVELLIDKGDKLVQMFMLTKAAAVGLNPIPLADLMGGAAIDAMMIKKLSQLYGIEFSLWHGQKLLGEIGKALGLLGLVEVGTHLAVSALDIVSVGTTIAFTAIPQGAAAGYTTYIVGKAAHVYFRNGGSWGDEGAKKVVRDIVNSTDKKSVIAELTGRLKEQVAAKKHKA